MSVAIEQKISRRTREACRKAAISKATYNRRNKQGTINEATIRDRLGWPLYSGDYIRNKRMRASN